MLIIQQNNTKGLFFPFFLFTVKRQVTSPACDDTDSLACTLLFTINTHMCADDCIANTICPRLCGKCSKY